MVSLRRSIVFLGLLLSLTGLPACAHSRMRTESATGMMMMEDAPAWRAMMARYATCHSYEDRGNATQRVLPDDVPLGAQHSSEVPRSESVTSFSTTFERATGAFRFTFQRTDGVWGVLWRPSAGAVRTWWTVEPRVSETPLPDGIEAFAGVSRGTSYAVPGLLLGLPDTVRGMTLQSEAVEDVRGVECVRLSASESGRVVVVWIGKADHALRRWFSHERVDPRAQAASPAVVSQFTEEQRKEIGAGKAFILDDTIDYFPAVERSGRFQKVRVAAPAIRRGGAPRACPCSGDLTVPARLAAMKCLISERERLWLEAVRRRRHLVVLVPRGHSHGVDGALDVGEAWLRGVLVSLGDSPCRLLVLPLLEDGEAFVARERSPPAPRARDYRFISVHLRIRGRRTRGSAHRPRW